MLEIKSTVSFHKGFSSLSLRDVRQILDRFYSFSRLLNGYMHEFEFASAETSVSPDLTVRMHDPMGWVTAHSKFPFKQVWIDPEDSFNFLTDKPPPTCLFTMLSDMKEVGDLKRANHIIGEEYFSIACGYISSNTDVTGDEVNNIADNIVNEISNGTHNKLFCPFRSPEDKLREVVTQWHRSQA